VPPGSASPARGPFGGDQWLASVQECDRAGAEPVIFCAIAIF
jgi:hypothetical protein